MKKILTFVLTRRNGTVVMITAIRKERVIGSFGISDEQSF